jgi:hypothetical protein
LSFIGSVTGTRKNIADWLAMPDLADIDFEIPLSHELAQPADFS